MLDVNRLLAHIQDGDPRADDSAVALALLIEGAPDEHGLLRELFGETPPQAPRHAPGSARTRPRHCMATSPIPRFRSPRPSGRWARHKILILAPTFASVLVRALEAGVEPLARQALAALTVLPPDVIPTDVIRLAAASGPREVSELAGDWLRLLPE